MCVISMYLVKILKIDKEIGCNCSWSPQTNSQRQPGLWSPWEVSMPGTPWVSAASINATGGRFSTLSGFLLPPLPPFIFAGVQGLAVPGASTLSLSVPSHSCACGHPLWAPLAGSAHHTLTCTSLSPGVLPGPPGFCLPGWLQTVCLCHAPDAAACPSERPSAERSLQCVSGLSSWGVSTYRTETTSYSPERSGNIVVLKCSKSVCSSPSVTEGANQL